MKQWTLCIKVIGRSVKLITHLHLVSRLMMLYLHSPPRLQGAVHKQRDSILSNINIKGDEMGGIHSMDGRMDYVIFRSLKLMYTSIIQSGPKKCIHSLLINIFGINLNEISISG